MARIHRNSTNLAIEFTTLYGKMWIEQPSQSGLWIRLERIMDEARRLASAVRRIEKEATLARPASQPRPAEPLGIEFLT